MSTPPKPQEGMIRGDSIGDSTRAALNPNARNPRRKQLARNRADSAGSTRRAFYQNQQKDGKRKRKKQETKPAHEEQTLAEVASLAIAQETNRGLLDGAVSGSKPAQDNESGTLSYLPQPLKVETTSLYMSSESLNESWRSTAPLPSALAPIRDVSQELDHEISSPSNILSPEQSASSGYFTYDQSGAVVRETFLLREQTTDSLLYSEGSISMAGEGSFLHGTNMLDTSTGGSMAGPEGLSLRTTASMQRYELQQKSDIANFSSMAQNTTNYGSVTPSPKDPVRPPTVFESDRELDSEREVSKRGIWNNVRGLLDPTNFLMADVHYDDEGYPFFNQGDEWTIRGGFRHLFYNPISPEFTSLQQFCWACVIGIVMGVYTAAWKALIEFCVDFVWGTIPETLKEWGFFTELDGWFPLAHYMWICPTIFGGVLSYIFVILPTPIPGQNEWISALHSQGVQDHSTFWSLFILATLGMASGLSLGPELPLVLTAGMAGSYLGVLCNQSVLQARVMNLTAASAAVGGFFGFPMAGAMFVLEIPHRMGLQYFEALSPATIASIVAVLVNRMVVGNDVTGYYNYPFLTLTLPSRIFTSALVYGLFGALVGVGYAKVVLKLKAWVHDIFHFHDHHHGHGTKAKRADSKQNHSPTVKSSNGGETKVDPDVWERENDEEDADVWKDEHSEGTMLLKPQTTTKQNPVGDCLTTIGKCTNSIFSFSIKHEPYRAAVAGSIAGFLVGITCMFVPHVMFWGEAQLQSLIDKGRTPLPVFGQGDEPTADLLAYGFCLIDPNDEVAIKNGFSLSCSALIAVSKIVVTGLSLGTGIIGGHFWGPLFTGCIASHFFTDLFAIIAKNTGFGQILVDFPCVAILCVMGSTHVVTFRAHLAIMLILTLTISAFDPKGSTSGLAAGDYSAVFPLLVVSVFVALMVSRDTVFYKSQRSRGDITALPEVLCEPGKAGTPMMVGYDTAESSSDEEDGDDTDGYDNDPFRSNDGVLPTTNTEVRNVDSTITQDDIELQFKQMSGIDSVAPAAAAATPAAAISMTPSFEEVRQATTAWDKTSDDRLNELLSAPMENTSDTKKERSHRRTLSASAVEANTGTQRVPLDSPDGQASHRRTRSFMPRRRSSSRSGSTTPTRSLNLVRVNSYGQVTEYQPSLIDQARQRASSLHRRLPSLSKVGNRRSNETSAAAAVMDAGALTAEDLERSFTAAANRMDLGTFT